MRDHLLCLEFAVFAPVGLTALWTSFGPGAAAFTGFGAGGCGSSRRRSSSSTDSVSCGR